MKNWRERLVEILPNFTPPLNSKQLASLVVDFIESELQAAREEGEETALRKQPALARISQEAFDEVREEGRQEGRQEERDKIEAAFHNVWELTASASDYTEDDYNVLLIVAQWCKFKLPPNQTER